MRRCPRPAADTPTFVLSNEWGSDGEGGLIDALIAAGHGSDTMYEVMQLLQPYSSGAIPADFMTALAACPADSEVKTVTLSSFAGCLLMKRMVIAQIRDIVQREGKP